METNERFIRVSSRLPIGVDIKLGEDVILKISNLEYILNCVKEEVFDKQDGTVDKVFVLKSVSE